MPQCTKHLAGKKECQQHSLLLGRGEENLETYNNINSSTEKPVTVSELKPESLTYFYTSILHGWWQLKQPRHNSATGCSKCPHLYWFYRQLRLKMLHPTHFSICMCILALLQRNQATFSCCYGNCNIRRAAATLVAKLAPPIVSSVCF